MIKIIFLVGKPASGKDIQANLLVKKLKFKKIVASDELKKFFKNNRKKYLKIGKIRINLVKQQERMNKGKLVAYRLISFILKNIILKNIKEKKSIVFSGSPRSLFEAKYYLKIIENIPNIKFYFIYIKISDQEAINRALKRAKIEKRVDDNLKVVKTRLKVFRKEIEPMINYLKAKGKLIEVNGEGQPERISKKILTIISG